MLRKVIGAMALCGVAATASAETRWDFRFEGFLNTTTNVFERNEGYSATFMGSDTNGDGIVRQNELTGFFFNDSEFTDVDWHYCLVTKCELENFSYDLRTREMGGKLQWDYHDAWSGGAVHIDFGKYVYASGFGSRATAVRAICGPTKPVS
ncbi:hypothetical protein [Pseudoduganella chitinolytica]|uniref:Uncharacterized protein n=1 Tax=Pseudoduganella chitinolytica TaxID=34070 RepID=A0ABY8BIP2_9BURK|nr:hypothetical protein [Pseudoduganella chitinolytica]WEF35531.1 hypothetical protein PX653_12515 [Pseudoduganella chitinolytica]